MYENGEQYRRRKYLEREKEKLSPQDGENIPLILGKNIAFGHVLESLKRVWDDRFNERILAVIRGMTGWLNNEVLPEKTDRENYFISDRIYNYGFWDGYKYKKSEELAEKILTEPYNRISEN
jgi:hypothetical protein